MQGEVAVSRERFLAFARGLALLTSCCGAPLAACGGASTSAAPPEAPSTKSTTSASGVATSSDTSEPMPVDGPCRCSWDPNQSSARRVCKRGEDNYEGVPCVLRSPSFE